MADARRLWSHEVIELVAGHVGASTSEVAEALLAMRSQRRYLLLGMLARTCHCTVIAAVDQLLARAVALKLIRDVSDDSTWRLVAEVQALARIEHANVVRLYEADEHDGQLYAAMELCDMDLEAWAKARPWPEILDRFVEAGRGLVAVHDAGLVHGDVKPENIFVKDDVAKLGDFGLATRPGWSARVGGTPGYIAPEVADGHRTAAGDVFAFACSVWSCLLGSPPFGEPPPGADSSAATLVLVERARDGAFSVTRQRPSTPPPVLAALRRALGPEPSERPLLTELVEQLAALRSAGTIGRWVWGRRLRPRKARQSHEHE